MENVFLISFEENGNVTYSINNLLQPMVQYTPQTIFILNGEEVSLDIIMPLVNGFAIPARIELERDRLIRLEVTTQKQ